MHKPNRESYEEDDKPKERESFAHLQVKNLREESCGYETKRERTKGECTQRTKQSIYSYILLGLSHFLFVVLVLLIYP